MKMKFIVEISTNKEDPQKLDIKVTRPMHVAKKWGGLVLLTYMGIYQGLKNSYKTIDGEVVYGEKGN